MSMVVRYEKNCESCSEIFYASFGDEDKKLCDKCISLLQEDTIELEEDIK